MLLFFHKSPSVPSLLQLCRSECGAACLAMILNYHGRKTRVSECRAYCGGGRDGINAAAIVHAGRQFGLQSKAYSLSEEALAQIALPAIIHWQFNHFVVLEKWSPHKSVVLDPAVGRRRIDRETFKSSFTGVALTFVPGEDFAPGRLLGCHPVLDYYLKQILSDRGILKALAQIFAASFILQALGLVLPVFTKILVDQVMGSNIPDLLTVLGFGLLLLVASHTLVSYLRGALLVHLQGRVDSRMMVAFLKHVLSLPYRFFLHRPSGDLLMRLSSNVTIREIITNQTLSMALDGFFVLGYLVIIVTLSPLFGGIVLGLGLCQGAILMGSRRKINELMQNDLAASAETQSYLVEILRGVAMVKASGGEDSALASWSGKFFKELNISLGRHHLLAVVNTAISAIQMASPLLLLWTGGFMVLQNELSLGTMLALQALGIAFLSPLGTMIETAQHWQLAGAYLDRIRDVVEAEPEQRSGSGANATPKVKGAITVKDVSFRYDRYSSEVLEDISFAITPGQKLVLVGRTGAGKSTLAMLLLGLFKPTRGQILYDGISLEDLDLCRLRRQFGAVLQECFLFHGSIRQNIAFLDPQLTLEKIMEAGRIAGIHEDIMKMPMGYETLIAEGGVGLSGGQRQRLSIARAIVHKPAILLLDEATSHLDAVTEATVDLNLNTQLGTRIVIAHRLSTIRNADLILVLENGKIVEQGCHEELMARNGNYANLVRSQMPLQTHRA